MARHQLIAALIFCVLTCTVSAQLPSTGDALRVSWDKDGTQPIEGAYVKLGSCDFPYGKTGGDGVLQFSGCPIAEPPETLLLSRTDPRLRTATLRRASFVASETPTLTVLLKNEVQNGQNTNSFLSLILSSTGTATMVALITGLFGTFITYALQNRKLKNDLVLQDHFKKAEERRTRLSKDLDNEKDFVQSAYTLVGQCIAAADGLIGIVSEDFLSKTPGPALLATQDKYRLAFEETERNWKAERYSTDLLIKLYHAEQNRIQEIWGDIDVAIAAYFDVCKAKYLNYYNTKAILTNPQNESIRKKYVERIVDALGCLTLEIALARRSPQDNATAPSITVAVK